MALNLGVPISMSHLPQSSMPAGTLATLYPWSIGAQVLQTGPTLWNGKDGDDLGK